MNLCMSIYMSSIGKYAYNVHVRLCMFLHTHVSVCVFVYAF